MCPTEQERLTHKERNVLTGYQLLWLLNLLFSNHLQSKQEARKQNKASVDSFLHTSISKRGANTNGQVKYLRGEGFGLVDRKSPLWHINTSFPIRPLTDGWRISFSVPLGEISHIGQVSDRDFRSLSRGLKGLAGTPTLSLYLDAAVKGLGQLAKTVLDKRGCLFGRKWNKKLSRL